MATHRAIVCTTVLAAFEIACQASPRVDGTPVVALLGGLTIVPVSAEVPNIRLNPDPMRVFLRQWVKLEARRAGVATTHVAWSVDEGAAGGSVTADGTYTAPAAPGLYHVTAVSRDDAALRGRISIEVVIAQELYDYGGPILPAAKVQLIWRGTADEFGGAVDLFHRFLAGVNGSAWLAILDQYMRGEHARVTMAGEITGVPAPEAGAEPAENICALLAAARLEPDPRTIYAVMVSAATAGFDHHTTVACAGTRVPVVAVSLRAAVRQQAGACTETLTPAERMLWAFSHELAETITDPDPVTAWADIFSQELADDCASAACVSLPTGRFSLNPLLSNAAHGCAF